MSDDIDNRLIDYDDNYEGEPPVDITWAVGQREPYVVDDYNGDIVAIVIVPTADGE